MKPGALATLAIAAALSGYDTSGYYVDHAPSRRRVKLRVGSKAAESKEQIRKRRKAERQRKKAGRAKR